MAISLPTLRKPCGAITPFILDTDGGAPRGDRMFLMSFTLVDDRSPVPVPNVGAGLPGVILACSGVAFSPGGDPR
jgi:hypothetical protein